MQKKTLNLLTFKSIFNFHALLNSFKKLNPCVQAKNPVMGTVYLGAIFLSLNLIFHYHQFSLETVHFYQWITISLWLTVIFANFSESVAENHSQAQAASLRSVKKSTLVKKLPSKTWNEPHPNIEQIDSSLLKKNDILYLESGDTVPADGIVIQGVASFDESAITGESAPVIREAGGDFNALTGGTRILSDTVIMQVTQNPGEAFLDKMINMVENSKRQKTPNELALNVLLISLTVLFIIMITVLWPISEILDPKHIGFDSAILISLLVCLMPTTISGLLSAIGISGMSRLLNHRVVATSGRAVEAAGDIDILLLDKTGTITLGNRQAAQFYPLQGISEKTLSESAYLASLKDETPEGRSIILLAKEKLNGRVPEISLNKAIFTEFTAQTRMSGLQLPERSIQKGAYDAIIKLIPSEAIPEDLEKTVSVVAKKGSTPLVVIDNHIILGVVELKDIVKQGIKERFNTLRKMGVKSVMITGDNHLTAAAIATESGVDDFLAESTPEMKLKLIRQYQSKGQLVAMTGDGTNDAPALAQADVAVSMNTGTQAAKEAANMVDLDSDPTKLIEIIKIGKALLMTRGALTTFSITNDIAKYFILIPAMCMSLFPNAHFFNFLNFKNPYSAITACVVFNALILILLLPLALKGVSYKKTDIEPQKILQRNLLIYGLGGTISPFLGIKGIEYIISPLF